MHCVQPDVGGSSVFLTCLFNHLLLPGLCPNRHHCRFVTCVKGVCTFGSVHVAFVRYRTLFFYIPLRVFTNKRKVCFFLHSAVSVRVIAWQFPSAVSATARGHLGWWIFFRLLDRRQLMAHWAWQVGVGICNRETARRLYIFLSIP